MNRNPCGSSSGSGAAVSANLCAAAVGTETDGSIVCPSNANGIVGIKPTVGLLSRSGIIPISKTQDTAGPMCRHLEDAALMLSVMADIDDNDPVSARTKKHIDNDYTKFLKKDGLSGKKIGIACESMGFHEKVDEKIEQAVSTMKEHGADVVDIGTIFAEKGVHDAE